MSSSYMGFVQGVMDASVLKRKAVANNISNYSTPNFKASKVSFDELFAQETKEKIKVTNSKHIESLGAQQGLVSIEKDYSTKARVDGNNVNLNNEMIEMVKNNYLFNTTVQAINKEFKLQKTALGKA